MNYKFRAWDKEANIMIYSDHRTRKLYDVYYGFEMNGQGELECRWEGEFTESHVLDGGTLDNLMQFTGLYDKNGVEIYEGDVLFHPLQGRRKVFYPYSENVASYGLRNIDNGFGSTLQDSHAVWEVIGNIFENPELLEKKQWNEQMEHYKLNDFEQSKEKTKYIKFECISCKKQFVLMDRFSDGCRCRACGDHVKAVGYVRRSK